MWWKHIPRITNLLLSGPDRLVPRSSLWAKPKCLEIDINDFCNLRCPHCPRSSPGARVNRGRLGIEDLRPLAGWFHSAMIVRLGGTGEPLIQEDICDVIDFIQSHGPTVSLITNATLIDEAVARRLVGPRPMLLNLSIDAGTREVFERVRLGASFDEVVANVDRLVAIKRQANVPFPVVNINMTLMRDTLGEINAVLDLAERWGAAVLNAQTLMFFHEGADRSQAVTNLEAREALARARPRAGRAGIEVRYVPLGIDYETQLRDRSSNGTDGARGGFVAEGKSGAEERRFFCPMLWQHFFVDVLGNVTYCCNADFGSLGNVRETNPERIWNHPEMVALRRRLLEGNPPPECFACGVLEQFGRGKMLARWRTDWRDLLKSFA